MLVGYDFYNYNTYTARILSQAILLSKSANWLNGSAESGIIEAPSSEGINITFNATNMETGIHRATIVIESNDRRCCDEL